MLRQFGGYQLDDLLDDDRTDGTELLQLMNIEALGTSEDDAERAVRGG